VFAQFRNGPHFVHGAHDGDGWTRAFERAYGESNSAHRHQAYGSLTSGALGCAAGRGQLDAPSVRGQFAIIRHLA
jgi:hypothetical protein